MPAFAHRGVVEGFYGPRYAHEDRLWLIRKIGAWGMNRYLYAPKDDALQRASWREPYAATDLQDFQELITRGAAAGVDVGFSVSPGLSIQYSCAEDRTRLIEKLQVFQQLGARFFSLGLDDVPTKLAHETDRQTFASLADAHAALANAVQIELGPRALLWLVPTDYCGIASSDYLETLGASLDPGIEVAWTGRCVLSPTIPAGDAAAPRKALQRRLLLWDNVPVSDGPMRIMLHLGAYQGRDPSLTEHASGVMLNTMEHARASAIAVYTAASFLRDPASYDAQASWHEAVRELGDGAPEAFKLFAAAHRFSACSITERDVELEACFNELREEYRSSLLTEMSALLRQRRDATEAIRDALADRRLVDELTPWLESHRAETERMCAAIDMLETLAGDGSRLDKALAFSRFQGRLTRVAPTNRVSYGPRRVFYPQLVSQDESHAGFGEDPVLFTDRCLAEDVVCFAEQRALTLLRP